MFLDKFRQFGTKTFGRYDGIVPCLVTIDPDLVKSVLVKNFDNFSDVFAEVRNSYKKRPFFED